MSVAVFQGFIDIHFEMIGFALDYLRNSNARIEVFIQPSELANQWMELYSTMFQFNLNSINTYNPTEHSCTFLLTDDDPHFPGHASMDNVIIINHHAGIRRHSGLHFVYTRPHSFDTNRLWALPVFKYVPFDTKATLLGRPPVVTCVGIGCMGNIQTYEQLLAQNPGITINVISRRIHLPSIPGLNLFPNAPASVMFEICKNSTHILFLDESVDRAKLAMSGALPLAFSTGCRIIMPSNWEYSFDSVQRFTDISDIMIKPLDTESLSKSYKELDSLIKHRDDILNALMEKIRR